MKIVDFTLRGNIGVEVEPHVGDWGRVRVDGHEILGVMLSFKYKRKKDKADIRMVVEDDDAEYLISVQVGEE